MFFCLTRHDYALELSCSNVLKVAVVGSKPLRNCHNWNVNIRAHEMFNIDELGIVGVYISCKTFNEKRRLEQHQRAFLLCRRQAAFTEPKNFCNFVCSFSCHLITVVKFQRQETLAAMSITIIIPFWLAEASWGFCLVPLGTSFILNSANKRPVACINKKL